MISLRSITEVIHADSAALMVPDTAQRLNYCYTSHNMPPEWVAIKNSYDENVSGGNVEVYKTGAAAITNHLSKDLEGHYIESVMIVPVKRDGQTIAMLELVHSTNSKVFTKHDLAIAEEFTKKIDHQLP